MATIILRASHGGSLSHTEMDANFENLNNDKVETSAIIGVDKGGTGQTSYTDGQLLIGNTTGNTLAKATLTAGTGINITNGQGTIEISASGSASTTAAGIVELATTSETTTGTDTARAVTPDGLKDGYQGSTNVTTLGTIATGTWNGSVIDAAYLTIADTNLTYTAATRVISSSTGTNATLTEVVAAGTSGLMTGADKTKLDGIATGAQVNVGTNITVTENSANVTIASSTGTNDNIQAATASLAGVMSATDKTKLDGIATGAQVNVATNLSYTASTRVLASSTGTNATLSEVVASGNSGLMTGSDKAKLNGIASGAQVNVGTNISITENATTVTVASSTGSNDTIAGATASLAGVVTNTTQTFGGAKTFNSVVTATAFHEGVSVTTGGTYAVSCTTGVHWRTLNAATTISFINTPAANQSTTLTLILQQDATGGRVVTWPATNWYWAENVEPPFDTSANAKNLVSVAVVNNGGTLHYFASLGIRAAS